MLRTRPGALSRRLDALKAAGLIEEIDGELRPLEWDKRQFVERALDPTAAERMRRFRERAADRNGAVTPPVTNAPVEEDQDLDKDSPCAASAARESAIDAFEEFLRVLPRRAGDHPRAPTTVEWRKAIAAGADPARVIAGAKAYGASVAGLERRFVVSAARWLAEERWPRAPAPAANAPRVEKKRILATSPEWSGYADRFRATHGKSPPIVDGGWWFEPQCQPAPLDKAA
jgi:hypothetical protein